jgi:outer membrane protein insertion porin family
LNTREEREDLEKQVTRYWKNEKMMVISKFKRIIAALFLIMVSFPLAAQEKQEIVDFMNSNDYIIGGVTVTGIRYLDPNALIGISGLRQGQEITIPGEDVKSAVEKLWKQGLFSDVRLTIVNVVNDTVFLDIALQERPRISSVNFNGLKKAEITDLTEKLNLPVGSQLTSYVMNNSQKIIKDHFIEKGFLNTEVEFVQKDDPDQPNNSLLSINVNKNDKVKIGDITFVGNENFDAKRLRRTMKGTKVKNLNFFRASKYIGDKYEEDKESLVTFYNDNGYKDFTIVSDSLYDIS